LRFSCARANDSSSFCVIAVTLGPPQNWIARWVIVAGSVAGSVGASAPWTTAAMNHRARKVAVSSQRVSSQPPTSGG
jgi:hypothetical protein